MSIFIPKEITVGFVNRVDTYTGQLAYIIYKDEKGVLRKKQSWESWRNKDIEPLISENVPTEGFVLNKKAGGYSTGWNHRQTYVRVYDPRGFEFEISIPNLLYILENTNSIKGKGLDGEFVYGWDGKELLLIPTCTEDYAEGINVRDKLYNKNYIKAKDLKVGATYKNKDGKTLIYMGKYDRYNGSLIKEGKSYFFCRQCDYDSYYIKKGNYYFDTMKSLGSNIISVVDENCVSNYAELFELLEHNAYYSPIDKSKNEYVDFTFDEFEKYILNGSWIRFFEKKDDEFIKHSIVIGDDKYKLRINEEYNKIEQFDSLKELFEKYKPKYLNRYLANGKLYETNEKEYGKIMQERNKNI